jgi:hypothetical protein
MPLFESRPSVLKRIWHDPVWSQVIAWGVLGAVTWSVNRLLHWWSWSELFVTLCNVPRRVWAFLLAASPVPHWLIGLAGLIVLLSIAILCGIARAKSRRGTAVKVQAKCIAEAWDSTACIMYKPGNGPLPGGLYEIDRDGQLTTLKTPTGRYIFEFDRNTSVTRKAMAMIKRML